MLRLDGIGRCGDYAEDNGGGDNDENNCDNDVENHIIDVAIGL